MTFAPMGFAIGTVLAEREHVASSAKRAEAGLLLGMTGLTPLGVVLAQTVIRNAARHQRETVPDDGAPDMITATTPVPNKTRGGNPMTKSVAASDPIDAHSGGAMISATPDPGPKAGSGSAVGVAPPSANKTK